MHCVCVLGTDTEIGKTYVTSRLARALVRRGQHVGVYKPVASGNLLGSGESDADLLRAAAQLDVPIERVCPQSFARPLAPPVAASLEGRAVDERELIAGAQWWQGQCQLLLVEGAGGVLSPISDRWTCLDLALQLAGVFDTFHLLLVTQHRLGMVNQVLMALEAIHRRELPLLGVYVNEWSLSSSAKDAAEDEVLPSLQSNIELLQSFTGSCNFFFDVEPLAVELVKGS